MCATQKGGPAGMGRKGSAAPGSPPEWGVPWSREAERRSTDVERRAAAPLGSGGLAPVGPGDSCCTSATGPRICGGHSTTAGGAMGGCQMRPKAS